MALLVLGSGQAKAGPSADAHLDPSFGRGGRVMLRLPGTRVVAVSPDGSVILSAKRSLRRLTPTGHLDQSFGEGGIVTPPPPAGGKFELAGVAVDPQGRLVVAGTSVPPQPPPSPQPQESPPLFGFPGEPVATTARIMRYLPSGALDPSFGDHGIVETDFGLPAPMSEGKQLTPKPLVKATGVAVDDAGHMVITGGAGAGIEFGCAHDWFWNTLTYAAFIARLTESGAPDTAFGSGDGVFGGHEASENPLLAEVSSEPTVTSGGGVTFLRGTGACPRAAGSEGAVQLTAAGELLGLEEESPTRGAIMAAADAPDGSVVFLEFPTVRKGKLLLQRVLRVGPDGTLSRSFGRNGRTGVTLPGSERSYLESIAVDSRGRVLLGGAEVNEDGNQEGVARAKRHVSLLLIRLRPRGGRDTSFGAHGAIATRFKFLTGGGGLRLDQQGRAVVAGTYWRSKDDHGVAVARYVLGR